MRPQYLMVIFTLVVFNACHQIKNQELANALALAGKNKSNLQHVIDHYSIDKEDTLKYKAAIYLITNSGKHSYVIAPKNANFNYVFDSIRKETINSNGKNFEENFLKRRDIFNRLVSKQLQTQKIDGESKLDVQNISPDLLIENIDLAFEAWHKIDKYLKIDFAQFCEYVLPYRSTSEIPENGVRQHLYEKYNWIYDSLKSGQDIQAVVHHMISHDYFWAYTEPAIYPYSYSIKELETKRLGTCYEASTYLINAFRSVGIPCCYESTPQWGIHHGSGHGWITIRVENRWYTIDPFNPKFGDYETNFFVKESIPKIYQYSFSGRKDVTNKYVKTSDLNIEMKISKIKKNTIPGLYIFNRNLIWSQIDNGSISDDSVVNYYNVGNDNIYLSAAETNGSPIPIHYPFLLMRNGRQHYFQPNVDSLVQGLLLRKYPPYSDSWFKFKKSWFNSPNGSIVQGANKKDFSDAVNLITIKDFNSSEPKEITLKNKKKFLYYRLINPTGLNNPNYNEGVYFAEISFIDEHGIVLNGDPIDSDTEKQNDSKNAKNAFDHNGLTYYSLTVNNPYIGMAFKKPKNVTKVIVQSRNDGNHIKFGKTYELFFWDKQWRSLGVKTAKDTLLNYINIPYNSLLWLRCAEGVEEHVFTLDKNGNQIWPLLD